MMAPCLSIAHELRTQRSSHRDLCRQIKDKELHKCYLELATKFVTVCHDIYIDSEPWENMAQLRTVRVWDNVQSVAESRAISTRIVTPLNKEVLE